MTLQEFLLTADSDNAIALQQARDYTTTQPVFITSNTMTVYVLMAGLYDVFSDAANDTTSPVRGICMALMDRLRGESEFNLSADLPLGQANIAMLDTLIAAMPDKEPAISNLKATLMVVSNKQVNPFANTTLHDVLIIRKACPTVSVAADGGYITVTTISDCDTYSARLFGLNPRTNKETVLGRVTINQAGIYEFKLPTHYLNFAEFKIDNPYGVI